MISVVVDPDARAEFLSTVQYYEECQEGFGKRFRNIVGSIVDNIIDSPFRYRIIRVPFRRYLLQKFPYSIIYSIEPDHIRIIAVAHTRQKPGYWTNRV